MFVANDELWNKMLALCKDYSANNGGMAPPATLVVNGYKIGSWYNTQLYCFRNGSMGDERKVLFEEFFNSVKTRPFPFVKNEASWLEQFDLYKQYVNENYRFPPNLAEFKGHKVGQWLRNQITALNGGFLPADRQALLDEFHPAWRGTRAEKVEAEKQMLLGSNWERLVPDGDLSLAEALTGDTLVACVVHGLYGCKQYFDYFESHYGLDFWCRRAPSVSVGKFGESVFSLESRKAVFETFLPRMSFECTQLLHDVFGRCPEQVLVYEDGPVSSAAEWRAYNASSRFETCDEMEQKCKELLSTLHQREKAALGEKYFSHKRQQEIADDFSLTNTRTGQIMRKGLRMMRHPSRSHQLLAMRLPEALSCGRGGELPSGVFYYADLDLSGSACVSLPDKFTVNGSLNLMDTPLEALPEGLIVHGDLFLPGQVKKMPASIQVDGSIHQKVVTRQEYSFELEDVGVSIGELGFSADAAAVLYDNGVYSKMDLLDLTSRDLMCMRGAYYGFAQEVTEKVQDMGSVLCEDEDFVGDLIDRAAVSCEALNKKSVVAKNHIDIGKE